MSQHEQKRRSWPLVAVRVAVIAILGSVIFVGVMSLFENRFVYFPVRAGEDWVEPRDLEKVDVELRLADGTPIHAWWCPMPGVTDALLYAHGNGGNLSHRAQWYRMLQEGLKVSVLAFDYPGYGKSGGSPSETGCYDSADAAWQWLMTDGKVAPDRVILFGESLGGGVATELAVRHPCRALVMFSSFTSIPDVGKEIYPFLPVRQLMRNRFDNLSKIGNVNCPVFVAHGDRDRMIGPHHAQRLYGAAGGSKCLHWIAGADHNDDMSPGMVAALAEFLRECPAKPSEAKR